MNASGPDSVKNKALEGMACIRRRRRLISAEEAACQESKRGSRQCRLNTDVWSSVRIRVPMTSYSNNALKAEPGRDGMVESLTGLVALKV